MTGYDCADATNDGVGECALTCTDDSSCAYEYGLRICEPTANPAVETCEPGCRTTQDCLDYFQWAGTPYPPDYPWTCVTPPDYLHFYGCETACVTDDDCQSRWPQLLQLMTCQERPSDPGVSTCEPGCHTDRQCNDSQQSSGWTCRPDGQCNPP
jgi:hypothetical protein